jgi:hypothetical protein
VLFQGIGDGGLLPPVVVSGLSVLGLAVADFNRDNLPDVAVVSYVPDGGSIQAEGQPIVTILLGDGRGGFRSSGSYPYPMGERANFATLAAGDINGDDLVDLVLGTSVAGGGGTVGDLMGLGDGTFGAWSSFSTPAAASCLTVSNLDGSGAKSVLFNSSPDSSGSGNALYEFSLVDGGSIRAVVPVLDQYCHAAGDLNRDGAEDIVVWDNATIEVYLNGCP